MIGNREDYHVYNQCNVKWRQRIEQLQHGFGSNE